MNYSRFSSCRRLWIFIISSLSLTTAAFLVQGQQVYFNNRYAISPDVRFYTNTSVVQPADTGYLVGGITNYPTFDPSYRDQALLLRFVNPDGQVRRQRLYRRANTQYYAGEEGGLLRLPDGGYALATGVATEVATGGNTEAMLWRFDRRGDTLWTRTYPDTRYEYPRTGQSGCSTRDGGFALIGEAVVSRGPSNSSMLLIRTDSLGRKLWERTYDRSPLNVDLGSSVVQTPDGGFLLGGFTKVWLNDHFDSDTYVIKVDALGQVEWERTFGVVDQLDGPAVVRVLRDGSYLVAGTLVTAVVNDYPQWRVALRKLAPDGQTLSQRLYGPPDNSTSIRAILELADGSLVISGCTGDTTNARPVGNSFPAGMVFKVCADGDSVWWRRFQLLSGGQSQNYVRDLQPTADGGFVGAGFVFGRAPDSFGNDGWLFKMDAAGYLQAGGAPPTRVCPRPNGLPPAVGSAGEVVRVYPNPSATGHFTLAGGAGAEALVLDALGRVVRRAAVVANIEQPLDLSGAAPGLYLLRLTWPDGRVVVRRLVR